jgi:hypothetical protein
MRISEEASGARTGGLTQRLLLRLVRNARYASAAIVTHNKMIIVEIGMVVIAEVPLRVVHLASVSLRPHHAFLSGMFSQIRADSHPRATIRRLQLPQLRRMQDRDGLGRPDSVRRAELKGRLSPTPTSTYCTYHTTAAEDRGLGSEVFFLEHEVVVNPKVVQLGQTS